MNDTDVAVVFPPQTLRTDTYFSRLVFEDNFEFIDLNKWEYEITAGGGGVSFTYVTFHTDFVFNICRSWWYACD